MTLIIKVGQIKLFILLLTFLFLYGCKIQKEEEALITSGIIEYELEYIENDITSLSSNLLPQKIELRFSPEKTRISMEGFMGLFSFELISNLDNRKNTTLIKFFDNKYVHYGARKEASALFKGMPELDIKQIDSTSSRLGFKTYFVEVMNLSINNHPAVVEYTPEIGADDPNNNNPFREIDGVLMVFPLKIGNIKIRACANEVKAMELSPETFAVEEGYKTISGESMDIIIDEILTQK